MVKKVVPSRQVAHLWANKSQDSARNSNESFYFTGPCIYSYRDSFMIAAHMDDGRVMWNDETYSVTTSGHKSDARNALTNTKWLNALHVPCLNSDLWRNIESIRTGRLDVKTIPDLVTICADRLGDAVRSMSDMRYGYGPMKAAFATAQGLEEAGKAILAYAANGAKKSPAWPLADLPAELPSKDALPVFIKGYAKAKLIAEYVKKLDSLKHDFARFADVVAQGIDSGHNYRIQNLGGIASSVGHGLSGAAKAYELANGKKSAVVAKLRKQFDAMKPLGDALFTAWRTDNALRCIDANIRNCFLHYGKLTAKDRRRTSVVKRSLHIWAMREPIEILGSAGVHAQAFERFARIEQWNDCREALNQARDYFENAETYASKFPMDESNQYGRALKLLNLPVSGGFPAGFLKLHGAEIDSMREVATAKIEAYKAAKAAKHATQVADWIAGTINSLPFDAGTYARIQGDTVQTSRGAIVPIEHACRLAKLARRIMASGGKIFADGAGPMVGGFRVNSIAADGACVIGCHEFDASEAMRLLAVLETCDACKSVAVETV